MLEPNNDRLNYGELLTPPEGYSLDFAVGTTYSLDLDALTGACLALGLSEETNSKLLDNPIYILEALRLTADKIALFNDGCQISVPNNISKLYILLEKIVFSIRLKSRKKNVYPSFHPKFWIIKYVSSNKDIVYRVIVLSRNLTFDRSWDVAFSMDGVVTNRRLNKNLALCDFLNYLVNNLPSNDNGRKKATAIRKIIKDIPYIRFDLDKKSDLNDKEFEDYEFIPSGIKSFDNKIWSIDEYPLFKEGFNELMVITPFLSRNIIKELNDKVGEKITNYDYTLITRALELEKLKKEDVSNFNIYRLKDEVIDGEDALSEEASHIQQQDIHAKVYATRKYSDSNLYIGSLNASENAINNNIELMIRLQCNNRYMNPSKLREELFNYDIDDEKNKNPFMLVDVIEKKEDKEKDIRNRLNDVIKYIDRSNPKARAKKEGELYTLEIEINAEIPHQKMLIQPLLINKSSELKNHIIFDNLTALQLSEFYAIKAYEDDICVEKVMIIPTENLPVTREKEVVDSVITDRECFNRYVAFLLEDDSAIARTEIFNLDNTINTNKNDNKVSISVYEKLLKALVNHPEKLDSLKYIIDNITKEDVIPDGFKELYDVAKKAVNTK